MCVCAHAYMQMFGVFLMSVFNNASKSSDQKLWRTKSTGLRNRSLGLIRPKDINSFSFSDYLITKLERWCQLPFSICISVWEKDQHLKLRFIITFYLQHLNNC